MHSLLTSIVLFLLVQTADACVTTTVARGVTPVAANTEAPVVLAATSVAGTSPRAGGELIKTAAAGTREAPPVRQVAPVVAATQSTGEEHPRRTGPAMLLAALALMSAIALRRIGASDQ
jgi:hypothetical protein